MVSLLGQTVYVMQTAGVIQSGYGNSHVYSPLPFRCICFVVLVMKKGGESS